MPIIPKTFPQSRIIARHFALPPMSNHEHLGPTMIAFRGITPFFSKTMIAFRRKPHFHPLNPHQNPQKSRPKFHYHPLTCRRDRNFPAADSVMHPSTRSKTPFPFPPVSRIISRLSPDLTESGIPMRKPLIAGNWKMNLSKAEAVALASGLAAKAASFGTAEVALVPAFVHIDAVASAVKGSPIAVGAQDVCTEKNGAFTGEISTAMLTDLGVKYVLVGHSERRHIYGESDALCNKKLHAVINANLSCILCVGEKLEERKSNQTFNVCRTQLVEGLRGIDKSKVAGGAGQLVIAYEPVWAIGTGLTATKEQAQEVHAFIRGELSQLFDAATADALRIQYGGSVKASNAAELLSQPDVDGALVGGAALKLDEFLGIIAGAAAKH